MLTQFFREAALRQLQQGLDFVIQQTIASAEVASEGAIRVAPIADPRTRTVFSGSYWQAGPVGPDGRQVAQARSESLYDAELVAPASAMAEAAARRGETVYADGEGPMDQPLRLAVQVVVPAGGREPVAFVAALDRSSVDAEAARFAALTWIALALMGAGLVAAVFLQVRFGLKPLYALEREIADVRKGKIQRLAGAYPNEIAPVAEELNALLDHNHEVVERQRTHVGNLAHALKTPLSVMLAEAGSKPGGLAQVVRRQAELMRAQVDHHLRRARAAARAQSVGERTSVEAVLDELATLLERVFADKGVEIDWRAPEDLWFRGERQDLQEIAGNVLENACKWGVRRVRATAERSDDGSSFRLVVEDDGPGLPAEGRDEVMRRGARLDESAPGSGLGLSIVDELARAYGGSVTLGDSPLGGLRVEVTLPAAEA